MRFVGWRCAVAPPHAGGMATLSAGTYGRTFPAFLDTLAHSEGTSSSPVTRHDGYDVIVSSIHGPAVFTDFSCHPFCVPGHPRSPQMVNPNATPPLLSTCSGRYQLKAAYWPAYQRQLGLHDFGPLSQDLIALQQIREVKAFALIAQAQITAALTACRTRWARPPELLPGGAGELLSTRKRATRRWPDPCEALGESQTSVKASGSTCRPSQGRYQPLKRREAVTTRVRAV